MRYWLIFVITLLVLVAAAGLAPVLNSDPGYVLIQFGSWTIETTIIVIAVAAVSVFIILRVLLWLLDAPRRAARNLARRRIEHGLLALAEGNWSQAEKALQSAAEPSGLQRAGYLAAARAASSQVNDENAAARQQQYLQAADNGQARTRFLLQLSRARLHIDRQDYQQAIPILKQLRRRRRQHAQVLKMLAHCYREQGHWPALRDILPAMRKSGVIDHDDQTEVQILAATSELQSCSNSEDLQKAWESMLKALRLETSVVSQYAKKTLAFELPRLAENALVKALDRELDDHLLDLYFQCQLQNPDSSLDKVLTQAEKWRRKHPDNAAVEKLLGQICMQQQLWGKAKAHLLESLSLQARQDTFQILGELYERQGEVETALRCYRNALQMSQGLPMIYPDIDSPRPAMGSDATDNPVVAGPSAGLEKLRELGQKQSATLPERMSESDPIGDLVTVPDAFHNSDKSAEPEQKKTTE